MVVEPSKAGVMLGIVEGKHLGARVLGMLGHFNIKDILFLGHVIRKEDRILGFEATKIPVKKAHNVGKTAR